MTNFLRFTTTTTDQVVYLDADSIIMISELRYRVNDIGYVGSTITFHLGTLASSINVKDDPDTIYHYLRKADLVHDQEAFLDVYNHRINLRVRPEPTTYRHPPQETPSCNGNGEAQSTEE